MLSWIVASLVVSGTCTPWQTVAGTGRAGFTGESHQRLVQTFGVETPLSSPWGLALDGTSRLYIADSLNHVIRSLDLDTGLLETIAGTGEAGFSDGTAVSSQMNLPMGLALDSTNQILYVADALNHRIRAVSLATGVYYQAEDQTLNGPTQYLPCPTSPLALAEASSLLLGSAYCQGSTGDGFADFVHARQDTMVFQVSASHGAGTYELRFRYADRYSEIRSAGQRQLRLTVNGAVVTNALVFKPSGPYPSGGWRHFAWSVASAAFTAGTNQVELQVTGHGGPRIDLLYVLPPLPVMSTVAGTGVAGPPSVEDVSAEQSAVGTQMRAPSGLVLDETSQLLYVADTENGRVRRLDLSTGTIRTIAGGAVTDQVGDGLEAAGMAKLFRPMGLALDATRGFLYVTDARQSRLRRIDLTSNFITGGKITSITGVALGAGFELSLLKPMGILWDDVAQQLYVADSEHSRLRVVDPLATCASELTPQALKMTCGEQGLSPTHCEWLGCCYDSTCGLPSNPDGRVTAGFQPEDVLTRVDGAKLDPPISFVLAGSERCCHPNLRSMTTLDVTPWPQGLAFDAAQKWLYVSQGQDHRVVRINLDDARCASEPDDSEVC